MSESQAHASPPGDDSAEIEINGETITAKMVEYAPGQYAAVLGAEVIPRYGVVRFDHVGKNHWRPCLIGWGRHIALRKFFREGATGNEPNPELARLGLDLSYNSVLRLYKNGFVRGRMPVPHRILIDLESLHRHLEATADPDFWTAEKIAQFKEVIY